MSCIRTSADPHHQRAGSSCSSRIDQQPAGADGRPKPNGGREAHPRGACWAPSGLCRLAGAELDPVLTSTAKRKFSGCLGKKNTTTTTATLVLLESRLQFRSSSRSLGPVHGLILQSSPLRKTGHPYLLLYLYPTSTVIHPGVRPTL